MSTKKTSFKKRKHSSIEDEENGHHSTEEGSTDAEQDAEQMQKQDDIDPPAAKRPRTGRPPIPDQACEHGPSAKHCHKCKYKVRMARTVQKQDVKHVAKRHMLLWMSNLTFFSSLAPIIILGNDKFGYARSIQIVENRIHTFANWIQNDIKKLGAGEFKLQDVQDQITSVLENIHEATPATVETAYMAQWILTRMDHPELTEFIKEPQVEFTKRIAALWMPTMACTGIIDPHLVDHFRYWKGTVWKTKDGIYAWLHTPSNPDDPNSRVRSIHCTGFTSDGLCYRCASVKRRLSKEKSTYKETGPGTRTMLNLFPPGIRQIFDRLVTLRPDQENDGPVSDEDIEDQEMQDM